MTSTIAPTATPVPSATPVPPSATVQPTAAPPVEGSTATQVNVRAQPSTTGAVLGIIPANTVVEILGRDPGGNWWQIAYPSGPDGRGWVTSQFVATARGADVPTIGGAQSVSGVGILAVIEQQLNVRSGPGTDFNSIGNLNPQDAVSLTGKDRNGTWLQIEFGAGPEGRGWISAAFVQADGVEALPIVSESGTVIGTDTPTAPPQPPTPTVVPAWVDNDSPDNPAARVSIGPAGTRSFIYTGDVSAPDGDQDDWVSITPSTRLIVLSLECSQTEGLLAEFVRAQGSPLIALECNRGKIAIPVEPGNEYLIHLKAIPDSPDLRYINYTLAVEMST